MVYAATIIFATIFLSAASTFAAPVAAVRGFNELQARTLIPGSSPHESSGSPADHTSLSEQKVGTEDEESSSRKETAPGDTSAGNPPPRTRRLVSPPYQPPTDFGQVMALTHHIDNHPLAERVVDAKTRAAMARASRDHHLTAVHPPTTASGADSSSRPSFSTWVTGDDKTRAEQYDRYRHSTELARSAARLGALRDADDDAENAPNPENCKKSGRMKCLPL